MNFSIGQKVICIKPGWKLKSGVVYTVVGTKNCPKCNDALIDIGYNLNDFNALNEECMYCRTLISHSIQWFTSRVFRLIDYQYVHYKLLESNPLVKEVPDITPKKEEKERTKEKKKEKM
jgi:hypothetical protein